METAARDAVARRAIRRRRNTGYLPTRGSQIAGCSPLRWPRVHGDQRNSAGKPDKFSTVTDARPLGRHLGRISPHMPRCRLSGQRGMRTSDQGYELRFQVTPNPLPLPLSAPGWALVAPDELIMVSSSSVKDEMTPEVEPAFTMAPDSVQLPKSGNG